jgi:hypothetical protein
MIDGGFVGFGPGREEASLSQPLLDERVVDQVNMSFEPARRPH